LKRETRLKKLPEEPVIPGIRRMVKKDAKRIQPLMESFLKYKILINIKFRKYKLYNPMNDKEIKHFLLPRENVVDTYVVELNSEGKKEITDFVSFYTLPSSVLQHETIKEMKAAYLYYYATTKTDLKSLVVYAMIKAKAANHEVFNCLNIMDNKKMLEVFYCNEIRIMK
jgi:glycylpeptide N-tetradecanoyltransferase